MLLVDFEVLMNEEGDTKTIPVNVDSICFLMPKIIPTKLMGTGNVPVTKPGTGIDFGGVRAIAILGTMEETQKKIEEHVWAVRQERIKKDD